MVVQIDNTLPKNVKSSKLLCDFLGYLFHLTKLISKLEI